MNLITVESEIVRLARVRAARRLAASTVTLPDASGLLGSDLFDGMMAAMTYPEIRDEFLLQSPLAR
jgi:hypothetical protein